MTQYSEHFSITLYSLCLENFQLTVSLICFLPGKMEQIKTTFAQCKREKRAALVTYVTAGYPTAEETPDIMLAMQAGGAGRTPAGSKLMDDESDLF